MNKNLTIEEQNHQIIHNQKVIINSLEQIKKHIWNDEGSLEDPAKDSEENNTQYVEEQAVNYIHNVLIPDLAKKEAEKGDMVAQSAWIEWAAKPLIEYLKVKGLEFIGKSLEELKAQLYPLAVDIADWALDQLENIVLKQYKSATEKQKEQFKNKISEKFPNSRLLGKL